MNHTDPEQLIEEIAALKAEIVGLRAKSAQRLKALHILERAGFGELAGKEFELVISAMQVN